MIRVVMVHQYDPTAVAQVGGVETVINNFVKYAPDDIEVRMIGITSNAQACPVGRWKRVTIGGRQVDFLPALAAQPGRTRGVPLSARLTWALMKLRRQADLENAVLTFHRIEPTLAVRSLRAPTVVFMHAYPNDLHNPMTDAGWRKAPGLYRWLERRLIPGLERLFVVREDAVTDYRSRYPSLGSRIQFLPTSVDDGVFVSWPEARRQSERHKLAQRYGLDANRRWVLFVGRFEPPKDPLLLLDALRELNGLGDSTQLIMIGRGTLRPQIEAHIARHKLDAHVRLVEPQPQAELVPWLNASDCLCLSSAYEGMPLALLEALQCGLPVVSTATGQTPQILREPAGLIVEQRTAPALARALGEQLSRTPDREACQKAAAPYTARKALEQVYAAYREVHAKGMPQ